MTDEKDILRARVLRILARFIKPEDVNLTDMAFIEKLVERCRAENAAHYVDINE